MRTQICTQAPWTSRAQVSALRLQPLQCLGSRGTLVLCRAHQLRQAQFYLNCQPGEDNWGDQAVGDPLSLGCGFPKGQGEAAQLPSSAHPCKSHCAPQRWHQLCFSLSPWTQTCRGCQGKELHHNPPAAPSARLGLPREGSLLWAEHFSHICCMDK